MKRIPVFVILVLACCLASAQQLWKIQIQGARPSYLLGTCHFIGVEYTDSIIGFDDAFTDCDTLYTEIGIPRPDQMQQALAKVGLKLMAQPPLGKLLTPDTALKLRDFIIRNNGGDAPTVDKDIQQLNLVGLLMRYPSANVLASMQQGSMAEVPMDMGLISLAQALDIDDKALESIDYQLELLCEFIMNNSEEAIKSTIEDDAGQDACRLIADYKSGELSRLYSQFEQYRGLKNMEELIDGRNRAWADRLEAPLRSGGVFIAVGAGHLPGESGLIALLRLRGFSVEPVRQ